MTRYFDVGLHLKIYDMLTKYINYEDLQRKNLLKFDVHKNRFLLILCKKQIIAKL